MKLHVYNCARSDITSAIACHVFRALLRKYVDMNTLKRDEQCNILMQISQRDNALSCSLLWTRQFQNYKRPRGALQEFQFILLSKSLWHGVI